MGTITQKSNLAIGYVAVTSKAVAIFLELRVRQCFRIWVGPRQVGRRECRLVPIVIKPPRFFTGIVYLVRLITAGAPEKGGCIIGFMQYHIVIVARQKCVIISIPKIEKIFGRDITPRTKETGVPSPLPPVILL
jgi:hypothetical protein